MKFPGDFIQLPNLCFEAFWREGILTQSEKGLLGFVLAKSQGRLCKDWTEYSFSQVAVVRETGLSASAISKACKKMTGLGILEFGSDGAARVNFAALCGFAGKQSNLSESDIASQLERIRRFACQLPDFPEGHENFPERKQKFPVGNPEIASPQVSQQVRPFLARGNTGNTKERHKSFPASPGLSHLRQKSESETDNEEVREYWKRSFPSRGDSVQAPLKPNEAGWLLKMARESGLHPYWIIDTVNKSSVQMPLSYLKSFLRKPATIPDVPDDRKREMNWYAWETRHSNVRSYSGPEALTEILGDLPVRTNNSVTDSNNDTI